VGPGNFYVQVAKKLLSGSVGIDTLAGPSEIVVLADKHADPAFVAWDLMAQAEHGEDSVAMLITDAEPLARKVRDLILSEIKKLPRTNFALEALTSHARIILVDDIQEALPIVNALSPEHISLQIKNPGEILGGIKNAGAILVGRYSPVAAGDYWAGPSHVIPTGGVARFSSPLGVKDFLKELTVIRFSRNEFLSDVEKIVLLAQEEKLFSHAQSLRIRKKRKWSR